MRQKKKGEESVKADSEKAEPPCVKCSKMQNGGHPTLDECELQSKQTTLGTLKSVLKRSASHKKDKTQGSKNQSQSRQHRNKDGQQSSAPAKKHKNRVQFDETRNKYFEADYVILIHEEDYDLDDYYDEGSPYDDEDDDAYDDDGLVVGGGRNICCSNPNCNNVISLGRYYASAPAYAYQAPDYVDSKYPERERFDFSARYYEEINRNGKKCPDAAANRCENEKCRNCRNYFDFEGVATPRADSSASSLAGTNADFGDHVTLSPPEGYKDGGGPHCCPHHGLQYRRGADASPRRPHTSDGVEFRREEVDEEEEEEEEEQVEEEEEGVAEEEDEDEPEQEEEEEEEAKERALAEDDDEEVASEEDPSGDRSGIDDDMRDKPKQRYIVETITMTTVTERRIVRETDAGKRSGILKGGKLWRNSTDKSSGKAVNYAEAADRGGSDDDGTTEAGDGEPDNGNAVVKSEEDKTSDPSAVTEDLPRDKQDDAASPESTELTLTFKLGRHVLLADSLKPNSAVRQLFPSPRFLSPPPLPDEDFRDTDKPSAPPKRFLVTAESLRLFEEAEKCKSLDGTEETTTEGDENGPKNRIRRTIERNALRRSLIRYPCDLRSKRSAEKRKKDNSLEERIKQLTCGVDDDEEPPREDENGETTRSSPQGQESGEKGTGVDGKILRRPESASSNSSSSGSSAGPAAYKKIADIFVRKTPQDVNCNVRTDADGPDLGHESIFLLPGNHKSAGDAARKQFLSTLAPLAACVTGVDGKAHLGERYRTTGARFPGSPGDDPAEFADGHDDRTKMAARPDVVAGTPQSEAAQDELALFVRQDAGRIEKLKKRYGASDDKSDEDDDYGFNKRPTVRGIEARIETPDDQGRRPAGQLAARQQQQQEYDPSYLARYRTCGPLPEYPYGHPSLSPPPVRHLAAPQPQPSPNTSEDGRNRSFDLGIPEITPRHPDGVIRNPESIYYRRTVPNVRNPRLQMKFSPVDYHRTGAVPAASIRFSASCSPHPSIVDESDVIIEPHYSTLPHPPASVGVIRVGRGVQQQMIRVPVPYPTGSPVQLHLMAGRPSSPQGPPRSVPPPAGQIHSYNRYLIAKGTQTQSFQGKTNPDGAPSVLAATTTTERVDFEAQGKAIAEEIQTRQKLSRSPSQEAAATGYHVQVDGRFQQSGIPAKTERGAPEGAASSSSVQQDGTDPVQSSGNTIYYSMNV